MLALERWTHANISFFHLINFPFVHFRVRFYKLQGYMETSVAMASIMPWSDGATASVPKCCFYINLGSMEFHLNHFLLAWCWPFLFLYPCKWNLMPLPSYVFAIFSCWKLRTPFSGGARCDRIILPRLLTSSDIVKPLTRDHPCCKTAISNKPFPSRFHINEPMAKDFPPPPPRLLFKKLLVQFTFTFKWTSLLFYEYFSLIFWGGLKGEIHSNVKKKNFFFTIHKKMCTWIHVNIMSTHHEHYSCSLHIMQCSKTNYSSLSSSCNSHKSTFTLCTLPLLLNIITEITILNKTLHECAFLPNKY